MCIQPTFIKEGQKLKLPKSMLPTMLTVACFNTNPDVVQRPLLLCFTPITTRNWGKTCLLFLPQIFLPVAFVFVWKIAHSRTDLREETNQMFAKPCQSQGSICFILCFPTLPHN